MRRVNFQKVAQELYEAAPDSSEINSFSRLSDVFYLGAKRNISFKEEVEKLVACGYEARLNGGVTSSVDAVGPIAPTPSGASRTVRVIIETSTQTWKMTTVLSVGEFLGSHDVVPISGGVHVNKACQDGGTVFFGKAIGEMVGNLWTSYILARNEISCLLRPEPSPQLGRLV